MLTIPEALAAQAENGRHKADGLRSPARFTVSGMLAGAYIGVGVVLMVTAAGPSSRQARGGASSCRDWCSGSP
ncbi:hypothetical protein PUW79_02600 [Microbacterium sp. NE2HP2]|nr:hypothetical protein [Microbacterium plantarum]